MLFLEHCLSVSDKTFIPNRRARAARRPFGSLTLEEKGEETQGREDSCPDIVRLHPGHGGAPPGLLQAGSGGPTLTPSSTDLAPRCPCLALLFPFPQCFICQAGAGREALLYLAILPGVGGAAGGQKSTQISCKYRWVTVVFSVLAPPLHTAGPVPRVLWHLFSPLSLMAGLGEGGQ